MKLPRHLAPWARHLQIFPDEISLILGDYAQRLAPFFPALAAAHDAADGEPNGYDGVARRGIYERLLLSELALADELADEFVRRAVMGEHLFLNLARVAPGARRVSIALFDAGALQIGAPRIAHLAAFVVLARRADRADARFLWGVLQDGGARKLVVSDDTEASVKILLESRTARAANEADVAEWRENLRAVHGKADVWLVGGENLARMPSAKDFSRLTVEENIEPEARELLLEIKSATGAETKRTVLELPPPDISTRLLRNPFERLAPANFTRANLGAAVTNFFFDAAGAKLFARVAASDDVLCFGVQNTPANGANRTVYRPDAHRKYHAAGRLRKAVAFASKVDAQTIRLEYRKSGFGLPAGFYQADGAEIRFPENATDLLPIYNARPRRAASPRFQFDAAAILDANRNLFLLSQKSYDRRDPESIVGALQLVATDVLAVAQTDNEFLYIGRVAGENEHRIVSLKEDDDWRAMPFKRLKRALFGRGEAGKKICALEDDGGNWTITDAAGENPRPMPPPKGAVVGVYEDARFAPRAGFFELLDDRRTLDFCWQYGRRRQILKADAEIEKIEFSPRSPILAYQTADGELVIYSLTYRAAIGRYKQ